mmetsp:Transcript_50984/g.142669  ORF Transcript_50984/g.142669 Transcript_50984/m.142669 type:complete len:202 (+) Transcript_50984:424-1029(+)
MSQFICATFMRTKSWPSGFSELGDMRAFSPYIACTTVMWKGFPEAFILTAESAKAIAEMKLDGYSIDLGYTSFLSCSMSTPELTILSASSCNMCTSFGSDSSRPSPKPAVHSAKNLLGWGRPKNGTQDGSGSHSDALGIVRRWLPEGLWGSNVRGASVATQRPAAGAKARRGIEENIFVPHAAAGWQAQNWPRILECSNGT